MVDLLHFNESVWVVMIKLNGSSLFLLMCDRNYIPLKTECY